MRIVFSEDAWDDYLYWQLTDRKCLRKINELIRDAQRTPHSGIGKPEPLKSDKARYWSRRITGEHRFVYKVEGNQLLVVQLRYHY